MRRIRGSDTAPEQAVRAELDRLGVPYLRNVKALPGTPDIALPVNKMAIFVHGCFWHGCPEHFRAPKTRTAWWVAKVARTRKRDQAAKAALIGIGWKVVEIWEHQTGRGLPELVLAAVTARKQKPPIHGKGKATNRYERSKASWCIATSRREALMQLRRR
jgi:DNA mismatch endonuclease (patch repair protein)